MNRDSRSKNEGDAKKTTRDQSNSLSGRGRPSGPGPD